MPPDDQSTGNNNQVVPKTRESSSWLLILLTVVIVCLTFATYFLFKVEKENLSENFSDDKNFAIKSEITPTFYEEVINDDFLRLNFNLAITKEHYLDKDLSGKFYLNLINVDTQKSISVPLSILPVSDEEVIFGNDQKYQYDKLYEFKTIAYLVPEISNGSYLMKIQYGVEEFGLDDSTIIPFLEADSIRIKLDRNLATESQLIVEQTYPPKGSAWNVNAGIVDTITLLKFSVESLNPGGTLLKAFELGTEGSGLLPNNIKALSIFDSGSGEKLSGLIDIKAESKRSNQGYNLYFLENPIKLSETEPIELELRASLSGTTDDNPSFRYDIGFSFVNIYALNFVSEQVIQSVDLRPLASLKPEAEIKVDITSPVNATVVTGTVLPIRWSMFFPSIFFKEGERPAFEIILAKPDSSNSITFIQPVFKYVTGGQFYYDQVVNFEYNLNLIDEGGQQEETIYRDKPITNGTYNLIIKPMVLGKFFDDDDDSYYYSTVPPRFRDEVSFVIQR